MNAYDTPEARRHGWQSWQGRRDPAGDLGAARGIVLWFMGMLTAYGLAIAAWLQWG